MTFLPKFANEIDLFALLVALPLSLAGTGFLFLLANLATQVG
jgi:hypothetical protein